MINFKIYTADELLKTLEIKDFDLYILIAIGTHSFLHEDIEDLYSPHKEKYYNIFKNSQYYNHPYLLSISALNYQGIQQFTGIYLEEKDNHENLQTLRLIKKGYKFINNYINRNPVVDIYELREKTLEYTAKNSFDSTISSFSYFAITIYLCKLYNSNIKCDLFDLNLLRDSFNVIQKDNKFENITDISIDNFMEKYSKIGIKKKAFKLPLNDFIAALGKIEKEKIIKSNPLVNYTNEQLNNFDSSIAIGIYKVAYMLQTKNIDMIDLQNITSVTHQSLNYILSLSTLVKKALNLSEPFEEIVGTFLMLDALIEDYKSIKTNYLVHSYEEKLLEVEEIKKQYTNKIDYLNGQETITNSKINSLEKELTESIEQNSKLQLKIKQSDETISSLQQKIKSLEENQKQLNDTIQLYEDMINNHDHASLDINTMINYLNSHHCIIIGGATNWRKGIKAHLKNWRVFSPDEINRNFNFINSSDIIFFNDSCNSHSMYNKIKSKTETTGAKLFYCGAITNIELSLHHMYDKLQTINS